MTSGNKNSRAFRLGALWLAISLTMSLSGCRIPLLLQNQPRTIAELYQEAVEARANYPEHTGMAESTPFNNGSVDGITLPSPTGEPVVGRAVRQDSGITLVSAKKFDDSASGPRVSEIFEETEIRQAIQSLATQAGQSVVMDDRIAGVTSAHIENEPFDSALRKILLPLGFVYKKRGNDYLIGVVDPASSMFSQIAETVEFRPLHLGPQELMALLPDPMKKFVQIIEKRNLILIEAPEELAQRIVSRLEHSDQPVPQVVLEAMVCVINPSKSFQFNLDAKQSLTVDGKDLFNVGLTGLAFSGQASPAGASGAFSDFALTSTFLRLLAQEGYVTIRAAPRVMSKDGEKATISINRETFFSTQPTNAGIIFQSQLQQVEAGITLDIIPVVRGNTVTVNIEKAEVSENIRQQDKADEVNTRFPLINRRKVSTTVHVEDGRTIVIGGLVQRQTIDRISRIPYLGDVPYMGRLFQYIDQEDAEAEVVIFIAPRIVRPACGKESIIGFGVATDGTAPGIPGPTNDGPPLSVPPSPASPSVSPNMDQFLLPERPTHSVEGTLLPPPPIVIPPEQKSRTTWRSRGETASQVQRTSPPKALQSEHPTESAVRTPQTSQPRSMVRQKEPVQTPASPSLPPTNNSTGSSPQPAGNSPPPPADTSNTPPREMKFLAPAASSPGTGSESRR